MTGQRETRHTLLLSRTVRQRLRAVVVDANSYGPIGPDINKLAALARDLLPLGLSVWVPEPVAWEWAEHLAKAWVTARAAARAADSLRKAGLSPVLSFEGHYADEAEVIQAFLTRLKQTPLVEVIPLTPESAIEGLKDQILQRRPAKAKSSPPVKTGGSDSAWLRAVLSKAGGQADSLLFLSSDSDISRAYKEWGHQPAIVVSQRDVRSALFEDVPASVEDAWLIAEYLVGRMPIDLQTLPTGTDQALLDGTVGLFGALHADHDDGITSAHLTRLTAVAGVERVTRKQSDIDDPEEPGARTLTAYVHFLADAEAIRSVQDGETGDVITASVEREVGLLVRARLTFTVRSQLMETVRSEGDAIVFAPQTFASPEDALSDLGEAISAVPGARLPSDWGLWKGSGEDQITVAGRTQVIDLSWHPADWGGLDLRIGDSEATVSCEYDETAWVGGKDGFHAEPPYSLLTNGDLPDFASNAAWELPTWIIRQLIDHRG